MFKQNFIQSIFASFILLLLIIPSFSVCHLQHVIEVQNEQLLTEELEYLNPTLKKTETVNALLSGYFHERFYYDGTHMTVRKLRDFSTQSIDIDEYLVLVTVREFSRK